MAALTPLLSVVDIADAGFVPTEEPVADAWRVSEDRVELVVALL